MQDENLDLLNSETEEVVQLLPQDPAFRPFARFAGLQMMKKELETQLKAVKDEMDRLQTPLLSYFERNNLGPIEVDGVTLHRHRDLYVHARREDSGPLIVEALRASGMEHYIVETYSTRSLSTHIRELEILHKAELAAGTIPDTAALLPAALNAVLDIGRKTTIRAVRSRRSAE